MIESSTHRFSYTAEIPLLRQPIPASVGLTEAGLVLGSSILARLDKGADAAQSPSPEMDEGRLLSLLSVAEGRPVPSARVMPAIEAAAMHWRRGDRALANLRLTFADLPRLHDPSDADRVVLAEHLLDSGMRPDTLMMELWPDQLRKHNYNPDQPRVPAGSDGGGQGTFGSGGFSSQTLRDDDRIIVAIQPGPPDEDEKEYQERRRTGQTTLEEDEAHGRPIDPAGGLLSGPGGPSATIEVPVSRYGEAARHVLDAQKSGKPSVLTIDRTQTDANRSAATGGLPKVPGKHLDEYPPAMFREGGPNASVRAICPKDNRALGAYIGNLCRPHPNGSRVKIEVIQ